MKNSLTKKALLLLLLFIISTFNIYANKKQKKDSLWKTGGDYSLVISQTALSNWASGGESSLASNARFNLFSNFKNDKSIWDNKLELGFGLQKHGEQGLKKIDDKFYLSSTYGRKAIKNWYYTFAISLKTQFANGFKYPDKTKVISRFFAPAYIVMSFGIEYKPNEFFSLNIAPLSSKTTIVTMKELSDAGAFGLEPGKTVRAEFVGSLKMIYKQEVMKNIELNTKIEMLSNYKYSAENVDVDWEVFIKMKVNSHVTTTLSTHLIYDDNINITDKNGNIGPRTQFKEIIGIGISSKF